MNFHHYLILTLISTVSGQSFTPPLISVRPRTWDIPQDEKIGTQIATISVSNSYPEQWVNLTLGQPRRNPFFSNAINGVPFFNLVFNPETNHGLVRLSKSLQESGITPGDQLSLEIIGQSNVSRIVSRHEVYIKIGHAIHHLPIIDNGDNKIDYNNNDSIAVIRTTSTTIVLSTSTTTAPLEPTSEKPSLQTKNTSAILTGVLVPLCLIIVITAILLALYKVYYLRKKRAPTLPPTYGMKITDESFNDTDKQSTNNSLVSKKTSLCSTFTNYTFIGDEKSLYEIPRHSVKILHLIGEGCFGQVWKGELTTQSSAGSSITVAIKTVKESAGETEKKDLLAELAIMKNLGSHPHVIGLLGCCTEKDPIFIISEFVSGGNLQEYLRKSRSNHDYHNLFGASTNIKSKDLTSYAYQVSKAMDYLSNKRIIHRDLAARNVLIDPTLQKVKVIDFGFARDIMNHNVYERKSEGRLPIRWMAPESLFDNVYTSASDVWSFGILLWEIVTLGSTPYPGKTASEVMKYIGAGHRLEKPEHCGRELYNLMYYTWNKDPDERPSFGDLVADFEKLLRIETDYIDLKLYPEHEYYNEVQFSGEKV